MLKIADWKIHTARTSAANLCNVSRRALALAFSLKRDEELALRKDGIAVIPDFLPPDSFTTIRSEAVMAVEKAEREIPVRVRKEAGFGAQELYDWGFDRFDGGTLNRFVDIDPAAMPAIHAFSRHRRISRLCRVGLGMPSPPRRAMIYLTVHGPEEANHDIQKDLHRDSFQRKMKYWYFLDPVAPDEGPFVYVPGSHKLTAGRLAWERQQAREHGIPGLWTDGAFRLGPGDLKTMNLPEPQAFPVPANTLVAADTFGFHRRGDAKTGARRLAIYGQKKPLPFTPIGF